MGRMSINEVPEEWSMHSDTHTCIALFADQQKRSASFACSSATFCSQFGFLPVSAPHDHRACLITKATKIWAKQKQSLKTKSRRERV